ncbi:peptide/nickel transport system permease protein [Antricoccus suffuscus]|uniref:Peptide/nickel transport system permease protein n=1 Tax=Antricoccus suffuscus TaxID=1629062 RepID=A0A2T1A021_9ACTN|nr:ABC transporter permease [Antricoccus suffuscus]PRZ41688.1 peptide/nickel transport system permease protein [Antricoccus suffuscus]
MTALPAQDKPDSSSSPPAQIGGSGSGGTRRGLIARSLRQRRAQIGLVLVSIVILVVVLGPLIAPYTTTEFVGKPFEQSSSGTVFGTDSLGRDVWSRFLGGGHTLLILAVLATILGVGGGALVGILAAYRRGWIDETIMRLGDIALAFPEIVLALLFLSIIGPEMWLMVLLVGLAHLPRVARVMRGAALSVVERDFVKSAEAVGIPRWKIMLTEILPNTTGTLAVEFGLRLTYSIGIVAGLNFLGLGLQPPAADWGLMINENRVGITVQMWPVLLPVVAIAILTVGTNLITDGIARASAGIGRGVEK